MSILKTTLNSERLKPHEVDDSLYEYKKRNGKEPTEWNHVTIFTKGIAPISINNKHGAINRLGEVIVPLIYDFIWWLQNGLIMVRLNNKIGFIDKSNIVKIPFVYEQATHFSHGFTGVKIDNKWGIIDKKVKTVIDPKYDYATCVGRGLYSVGLLTPKIQVGYDKFSFPYRDVGEHILSFGIIDRNGRIVIPSISCSIILIIGKEFGLIHDYDAQIHYLYHIQSKKIIKEHLLLAKFNKK